MAPKRTVFVAPGDRFGRGVVVGLGYKEGFKRGRIRAARLLCDCGREYTAVIYVLVDGGTQSCGCLRRYMHLKLTPKQHTEIEVSSRSVSELAIAYKVSESSIRRIRNGQQ